MTRATATKLSASERRLLEAEARDLLQQLAPEDANSPERLDLMARDLNWLPLSGVEAAVAAIFAEVVHAEAGRLRRRMMH